jgi:hypothetical protein
MIIQVGHVIRGKYVRLLIEIGLRSVASSVIVCIPGADAILEKKNFKKINQRNNSYWL